MGAPGQQLGGLGHGADVGGDVDGVGDNQKPHQEDREPARANLDHVRSQALSGHKADARREHLDADHQWRSEQQRPHQPETELRPRLRVGRDAARVVVGSAGDQARAQAAGEVAFLFAHAQFSQCSRMP